MANLIVNGFNVGTELQHVILSADNGPSFPIEQLGHLKEINSRQQSSRVICSPVIYNGRRLHRNIYHDWSGELVLTRFNMDLTNLIVGVINRFQQTGAETYFSLYATISNTSVGSEDEMLYTRMVLDEHDPGRYNGMSEVDISIAFRAQSLVLTGGAANVLANGASLVNT
jgi:hypothetical protein